MHTYFVKMDHRMHDTLYMCIYSSGLESFAAWAPGLPSPRFQAGPEPQKHPARSNIYTCMVYHACAGPFWRMRLSIYFDNCLILFNVFTCFGHNSTHNAPFYDLNDDSGIPRRDLSLLDVKTLLGAF